MTSRGSLDSLVFQVILPENSHLTDLALSKKNPAGKGQDTGHRVMSLDSNACSPLTSGVTLG